MIWPIWSQDGSTVVGSFSRSTDTGMFTRWDIDGNVIESRPLTDDEIAALTPRPTPLDPVGALATLLAVTGTVTVDDAANAVGLEPGQLVAEAEAWAVAAQAAQTTDL